MHRLTRGTLHKIIDHRENHHPAGPRLIVEGDVTEVGSRDMLGLRGLFPDPDERLIGIGGLQGLLQFGDSLTYSRCRDDRGMDSPVHRGEMRNEGEHHLAPCGIRKLLLDFGEVPMPGETIGLHVLIALGVEIIDGGLPSRTAHPAGTGGHNPFRIKQPSFEQGNQRKLDACRITTGAGDER